MCHLRNDATITWASLVNGLPVGPSFLYLLIPNKKSANAIANTPANTPNPTPHPTLSCCFFFHIYALLVQSFIRIRIRIRIIIYLVKK
jgi:hypothetical protein